MKVLVWVIPLLGLLACGNHRLGVFFTGRDAAILAKALEPQVEAINTAIGCDVVREYVPDDDRLKIGVRVDAEALKARDLFDISPGDAIGLYLAPAPYEDAALILSPFLMPATVLPTGFDSSQPVGANEAWLALDTIRVVFTHEIGHALGLDHQAQGVMFAYTDFKMTPEQAALGLAETLIANGLNPCHR